MDVQALTPEQQKRLTFAQRGLTDMVTQCQKKFSFSKKSPLICGAYRGVSALSLAEASWLNQKDWTLTDKTFILYHVDKQRNKRRSKLDFTSIYVLASLSALSAATWHNNHKTLASLLSIVTVATALEIGLDCLKNRTLDKITQNKFNHLSKTNENIKTAMRCLTPRATFTY